MDAKTTISTEIGAMVIRQHELMAELRARGEELEGAFEALASVIRDGQVPQERVPGIMAERPAFAAWYKAKHPPEGQQ